MEIEKSLINLNDARSIMNFLQAPAIKIAELLTGILAADACDLKLTAGRLVQASIKNKFLTQLGEEIKSYSEKGKIKNDFFTTHKEQASLNELLEFIDEEIPDEERFRAMKSIFLYSITTDVSEDDKLLAYELLKICKKISSSELLILKACFDICNGDYRFDISSERIENMHSADEWLHMVSKHIGHNISALVEVYEENLTKLSLISRRLHVDRSGIGKTKYFRLTTLGYKLCEFITKYP